MFSVQPDAPEVVDYDVEELPVLVRREVLHGIEQVSGDAPITEVIQRALASYTQMRRLQEHGATFFVRGLAEAGMSIAQTSMNTPGEAGGLTRRVELNRPGLLYPMTIE